MTRANLSAWAVRHPSFVFFLMAVIAVLGVMSFNQLGRAEDPPFTVKTMVVAAVWPGASVQEIEKLVADPIETELQGLPYLGHIETYSKESVTYIRVTLKDSIPPPKVDDMWYQVRKRVGDVRDQLPAGVQGPFFNDEYSRVSTIVYALASNDAGHDRLVAYAEQARQTLERAPEVESVELVGEQARKIFVEISFAKLATLGVPPGAIFEALSRQNALAPAGAVETGTGRVLVRVDGRYDSVEAVAATPIAVAGQTFRLGDIAEVRRGLADPPSYVVRHEGESAVMLSVEMRKGANGLRFGETIKPYEAEIASELPAGITFERVADQPHVIAYSYQEFIWKCVAALAIVMVITFLALGWRTGVVVALAVPLTLALTFLVMFGMGTALERISLGALILSLGLLVDDAIIAVEMMVVKLEEGLSKVEAASFAWTSTAFPMLTGTLVTAAGFLPVGFAASTAGEYAGGIFWVVTIALVASWLVAVFFTPLLGVKLLPAPAHGAGSARAHERFDGPLYRRLRRAVIACMERPRATIGATIGLFGLSFLAFGLVPQQFFPTSSRPEVIVELRMPEGASFAATEALARKVEKALQSDRDVQSYSTYLGAGAPRFFLALDPNLPDETFAVVIAQTKNPAARNRVIARLEEAAAAGAFAEGRVLVKSLLFGPPIGFPVQFRVLGPDPAETRRIAEDVLTVMRKHEHVISPHLLVAGDQKSVRLEIDQDRVRALGIFPQDVALATQTLLSGATVTQVREGRNLIDVVVRAPANERIALESLMDLTVTNAQGQAIPLSQIARPIYSGEPAISWRRDREAMMVARSEVRRGIQAPDVTADIVAELEGIKAALPPGYRIELGGAVEESAKANAALFPLFPVMIIVMLTLLMAQLQNLSRAIMVFATFPLGFIGASFALLLAQAAFGFVALLGVIAIGGMIMRNSVILVDQIEREIAAGMTAWEAVAEATIRRARPVVLTALAAIFGFLPLTLSTFWGPMAIAMIGGLTVATVLTLLFLPALYVTWTRARRETGTAPEVGNALAPA